MQDLRLTVRAEIARFARRQSASRMTSGPHDPHPQLLAEKDQLIAALTEQLELTVNQLDRLQRSGAERLVGRGGGGAGEGGANAALNAEILGRLSLVLDQWHQIQPAEHLLRIELGLDSIQQKLDDLVTQPAGSGGTPQSSTSPLTANFWEATKARLLDGDQPNKTISPSETMRFQLEAENELRSRVAAASSSPPVVRDGQEPAEVTDEALPVLPDPPAAISLDADQTTLLQGIDERDHYIQTLSARLRSAEMRRFSVVPWTSLKDAPTELVARLKELECVLQEQLKQAEIANSLERAVLARERGRLIQVKQSVEDQIRQMKPGEGNRSRPAPTPIIEESGEKSVSERRWKRLFSK